MGKVRRPPPTPAAPTMKKTGIFEDVLSKNVKDVVKLYGDCWSTKYEGRPVVTGKERSKLADLLRQVMDVVAVKRALRYYFTDDTPKKAGHSMAWFIGSYNQHAVASSMATRGGIGGKAKACSSDDEFEQEVRRFKKGVGRRDGEADRHAQESKQPGKRVGGKVRRRKD